MTRLPGTPSEPGKLGSQAPRVVPSEETRPVSSSESSCASAAPLPRGHRLQRAGTQGSRSRCGAFQRRHAPQQGDRPRRGSGLAVLHPPEVHHACVPALLHAIGGSRGGRPVGRRRELRNRPPGGGLVSVPVQGVADEAANRGARRRVGRSPSAARDQRLGRPAAIQRELPGHAARPRTVGGALRGAQHRGSHAVGVVQHHRVELHRRQDPAQALKLHGIEAGSHRGQRGGLTHGSGDPPAGEIGNLGE